MLEEHWLMEINIKLEALGFECFFYIEPQTRCRVLMKLNFQKKCLIGIELYGQNLAHPSI